MAHPDPIDTVRAPRGGDPLAAMYVLASFAVAIAAIVIVVLMFVPTEQSQRIDPQRAFIPGSLAPWSPPDGGGSNAAPGVQEIAPGRYLVTFNAYNWSFRPNEIRVPAGSEVTFQGRSVDDYHGIAIAGTPVVLSLDKQGQNQVTHTFEEPGEFPIVCSEYCGAGHISMTARVIVD